MPKKTSATAATAATTVAKTAASSPAKTIAQLKITLRRIKPAIWRRVLVPHDIKLPNLNHVIQAAMGGWVNSHLHSFFDGNKYYQTNLDDFMFGGDAEGADESKYRLSDLCPGAPGKLLYTYDFGDDWEHAIVLEKLMPAGKRPACAELLAGENACPPEDCGGAPGYYNLIEAVNNPKNPDYEHLREWFGLEKGDTFDPTAFNPAAANARLARIKV